MRLVIPDSGALDAPPISPAPAQAVCRFAAAAGLPGDFDRNLAALTRANVAIVDVDAVMATHNLED